MYLFKEMRFCIHLCGPLRLQDGARVVGHPCGRRRDGEGGGARAYRRRRGEARGQARRGSTRARSGGGASRLPGCIEIFETALHVGGCVNLGLLHLLCGAHVGAPEEVLDVLHGVSCGFCGVGVCGSLRGCS
jgi:hypothetical protein